MDCSATHGGERMTERELTIAVLAVGFYFVQGFIRSGVIIWRASGLQLEREE
jgi:hypothetical protein